MAEHSAVNRRVVSSSLTCGANLCNKLRAPLRCPFLHCDIDCDMTLRVIDCDIAFTPQYNQHIYMQNRIEVFEQMLTSDPENTMVMFGLAKEYEKLGQHGEVIRILKTYLIKSDDEGNAYGMLARAYELSGDRGKAIETYKKGIDVAMANGHPSMANEYKMTLDLDFAD